MTETSTTTKKAAKKATKKATKRAPSGPSKTDLEQRARDAQKEADAARAEVAELTTKLAEAELRNAGVDPDQVRAEIEETWSIKPRYDMDRYLRLCRLPFSSTAMDVQARSVCKQCNEMRGFRDTCQRHQFVNDGACSWSMPTGIESDEPLRCPGGHNTSALHLSYVGHAALTNRLIEIDPGYGTRFHGTAPDGNPAPIQNDRTIAMWLDLTICGITHTDVGTAKRGGENSLQSCYANALRRAAMRHGIGLQLWAKGDLEVLDDPLAPPPDDETSAPAPEAVSSPAPVLDEQLVDAAAMAKLNDEVALLANDDVRKRTRAHIRNKIKAPGVDRKLLTVTEHADAMAYVAAKLGEQPAPEDPETGERVEEPETGTEAPGDVAPVSGPDDAQHVPEAQEGEADPGSGRSDGSEPVELTLEAVQDAMFKLTGDVARQVKTALEGCDLWPIADHADELGPIWEVMTEELAK